MLTMSSFVATLLISFVSAFRGAIPQKTRAIIFTENPHILTVRIIIETPLSANEQEQISVALTEILADFPQFETEHLEILCSTDPLHFQLPEGEHFFFLRFEEEMWKG